VNELALFAGAGGGILGGHLLGWRTVCAVEWEQYPASVLCARQNDGILPTFPIWDDIQTFDGKPWRGIVQVVSGGFPCQDISAAGGGAGIEGERSGMWREMARVVDEVRPKYVFVENSPMLTSRGLGTVLGDLATMGFDAKWGVLSAADVGAPHRRDRIWILARQRDNISHTDDNWLRWGQQWAQSIEKETRNNTNSYQFSGRGKSQQPIYTGRQTMGNESIGLCTEISNTDSLRKLQSKGGKPNKRRRISNICEKISDTDSAQRQRDECTERGTEKRTIIGKHCWWEIEPNVGRVADGVAARVDRLKAIGNGQVSLVASTAWKILGGNNDVR
jgi:DNA (cytosine-5)-methyltransferase 1